MPRTPGPNLRKELIALLKSTNGALSDDEKKTWSSRTKMQKSAFAQYYKNLARDLKKGNVSLTGKRQRDSLGRVIRVLFAITSEDTCAAVTAALLTVRSITRALIVEVEYIEKIFDLVDPKTLELRSKICQPGWLYLVGKGGAGIMGEVQIVGCEVTTIGKLRTPAMQKLHKIDATSDFLTKYDNPHVWRLENAKRYDRAIPWQPAQGCQDWCRAGVPTKCELKQMEANLVAN